MLLAALVGLFASSYLLITYVSGKPIVCGTESGCELVRASPQAKTVFGLPRPLLGVLFYLAVIATLVARTYMRRASRWWTQGLLAMTGIGFLESAWLFLVQTYQIHAYCTWCLTSGAVATVLFVLAFFEGEDEPDERREIRELTWTFYALLLSLIVGGLLLWNLLARDAGGNIPKIDQAALNSSGMALLVPEGTPVLGPATSTVTVTEFLDLECPSCRAYHATMQRIMSDYAGRVRFAARLFPLYELHPHAKAVAGAAICAQAQGKYWEYADAALLNQHSLERADLVHYAEALKLDVASFTSCLDDAKTTAAVDAARKAGEKLGINATPTIFVNDEVAPNPPSYEEFKALLDAKLK